jgi:hypothetical protein
MQADPFWEFITNWTFMLLMAGCLLVIVLVGLVLVVVVVSKSSRRPKGRRFEDD